MDGEVTQCRNNGCGHGFLVLRFGCSLDEPLSMQAEITCPYCGAVERARPGYIYISKPLPFNNMSGAAESVAIVRKRVLSWGWKP